MFQNDRCLGVDLSGREIRVVELAKTGSGYSVLQAARLPVSGGDIGVALRYFLLETETAPGRVVCSLPASECSIKFAELPKAKPAEQARMARFEAETQIPLPISDIAWDFAPNGRDEEMNPVVIAGARRVLIDETLSALSKAEIAPGAMMISPLAGLLSIGKHESVFVISVGGACSDLTIVEDGRIQVCRCVHAGVDDLAKALDIEPAELVGAKQIFGSAGPQAVDDWLSGLALEIRRSVLSIARAGSGGSISRAVLIGEGADVAGLAEALSGATGLAVETVDPWAGMTLGMVAKHNRSGHPAVFAAATGLAIAGLERADSINLMPRQIVAERTRQRKEVGILAGLGAAALALFIIFAVGHAGVSAKATELQRLDKQANVLTRETRAIKPELRTTALAVEKIVDTTKNDKASPVSLIAKLSASLPRSVWLTDFRFATGKEVVLRGGALSNSSVSDVVSAISKMGIFDSVSLDYSNLAQSEGDSVYNFQVKCTFPQEKSKKKAKTGLTVR